MKVHENFDKILNLISQFNGVTLNIEEKTKIQIALKELHNRTKDQELFFWGKIYGEESDYFIAVGIDFHRYAFPKKKFYYCSQKTFTFEDLPETFPYHDGDFLDNYSRPLKGDPKLIIKKYKEENPEGEEGEEAPAEGEEEENKNLDPDISVDENAPKKEEPKENFTEELKLSYIVRQIDTDTSVVPEGSVKLLPEHELRFNKAFKGLKEEDLRKKEKYLHFRPIVTKEKLEYSETDDACFKYDILDDITTDVVKGSWSIQLDSTRKISNVRSLLWPGYYAVHQSNSNIFGSCYFGNGQKNAELAFMI